MTMQDARDEAFERTLRTWLSDGAPPAEPPELLERVLATTAGTARRPAWWAPWRRPAVLGGRSRRLVPAFGIAVVALAALGLLLALAAGSQRPHLPLPLGRPGLLVAGKPGELLLLDPTGAIVGRTPTGDVLGIGAWSHDGRRLAHADGRMEHPDLVVTDDHLVEQLRIPLPAATVPFFSWSPDDRQIAFGVETDTQAQVFVVDVAAGAQPRAITDISLDALAPTWSPDGDLIAIRGGTAPNEAVYVVHPDGSGLTQVTHVARGIDPTCGFPWTPDGRRIVFGTAAGSFTVWIVDRDGQNERMITAGNTQTFCPSLSPDGTRMAAPVWGPVNRFITIFELDGAAPPITPDGPIWDGFAGVWSPDGRTVAMNGRSITGGEDPRAFLDPAGVAPARTFLTGGAVVTDWQRLAP